mmetsp:Transcript_49041/g.124439  ORF Transcript_49041/g.124439 Transcript_49041/m.124439 type:complete len:211 (-) Transcript_49041:85-717(-)
MPCEFQRKTLAARPHRGVACTSGAASSSSAAEHNCSCRSSRLEKRKGMPALMWAADACHRREAGWPALPEAHAVASERGAVVRRADDDGPGSVPGRRIDAEAREVPRACALEGDLQAPALRIGDVGHPLTAAGKALCQLSTSGMLMKSTCVQMMCDMPAGATERSSVTSSCEKYGTSTKTADPPRCSKNPHGSASSGFRHLILSAKSSER